MCSKLEIKNLSVSDISDEESLRKYIICCKKMTSDIKLQNSFQVQRCSNIFLPSRFPRKTNSKYIFSIAISGQNVALTQTASQSDTLWDYTAGKIPTDAHFGHGCMDDEGDNYANYADDDNTDDDNADDDDADDGYDDQAWPLTGRRTQHAASLRALPTSGGGRCSFLEWADLSFLTVP